MLEKKRIYIYINGGVLTLVGKDTGIPKVPIRDTGTYRLLGRRPAQTVVRRAILYPYIGRERQPLRLEVLSRDTDGSDTKWG